MMFMRYDELGDDISREWNTMTTTKKNESELQQLNENFFKVLLNEKSEMKIIIYNIIPYLKN